MSKCIPPDKKYQTLASVEARLAKIEEEKQHLLSVKKELKRSQRSAENSDHYSVPQKVAIFRRLFRGRSDVFAYRWENKKGRSGYSVACDNEWVQGICRKPQVKCMDCSHRQFTQLSDQVIYSHLSGQKIVGVYPLLQSNTCYLLAIDFDKGNWRAEVQALSKACTKFQVPHAIEISRSGDGAHLWVFFSDQVLAKNARQLGFLLLNTAMEIFPNLSFDSYDRLFPNQDFLPEGGFGNLIALPLQLKARQKGHSVFVDVDLNCISDQWLFLSQLKTMSQEALGKLLSGFSDNNTIVDEQGINGGLSPWELTGKLMPMATSNMPNQVQVTLANHIYLRTSELPNSLTVRLRRIASFSNPVFFKTQALRFSTHGIPRVISCARIENGYLALPRGCLDEVLVLLEECKIEVLISDERQIGSSLNIQSSLVVLRNSQKKAVQAISSHDTAVLHAPTAFGKTVTAIGMILKRNANTLILVHSRQLLDQWKERLNAFLPDVEVGTISGGKKNPTGVIDVATYQSLINKKENLVAERVQDYGHVIVDECHHVSAARFEMVLNEVRAKYVLGLTATPERQDGHQKIIFMSVGPIRHEVKSSSGENLERTVVVHQVNDPQPVSLLGSQERLKISEIYSWIIENDGRTQRLVDDVVSCLRDGRNPIILTERRAHSATIESMLMDKGVESVVLTGGMRSTQREKTAKRLQAASVVVATGKYVGEGFDMPRLDTLFLAMPIAWRGTLAQYAGRIHRESEGKNRVVIHDYVDCSVPMLERMFKKREKCYRAMGYHVAFEGTDFVF